MRPHPFSYVRAQSLEHAIDLLTEHGEEARPLAGGQSLIPLMKLRVVAPTVLVDLNRLPGLDELALTDGWLTLGPLVRHVQVERSTLVRDRLEAVHEAVSMLADVPVRNLGTVAGAAAEADPSGDWGPVFLAFGGEIICQSTAHRRVVPMDAFFVDYLTADLEHNELITELRLRVPPAFGSGSAYLKLERRVGDFAVVSVAVSITLDAAQRCVEVGIGLGGVGLTSVKATAAEDALRGEVLDAGLIAAAAERVDAQIAPLDDGRGPSWYKRDMARVFVGRALDLALGRARAALA